MKYTYTLINELLEAHGKSDADGRRLLECILLVRGAAHPIQGVLSIHHLANTSEATCLKMLSKVGSTIQGVDRVDDFVEQFFDFDDVALIGVQRQVVVTGAKPKPLILDGKFGS